MVSAPSTSVPISGADEGIRSASSDDQEPERKVRVMAFFCREERKAARISGVISRSFCWAVGEIKGGLVVVAQVKRRLGRVASRSTESL